MIFFVVSYGPLKELFVWSFHDEIYDYILVIPVVSVYFFYLKRKEIFSVQGNSFEAGTGIIILGIICYLIGMSQESRLKQNDYLSIITFSSVIIWIGGLVFFYGLEASRRTLFPLMFLFLIVPIPTFLMGKIISFLQEGSAEAASILFQLSGVPVLREGFIFHLPKISIEVAKQCSGIHSGISLFITGIIAGKLFLVTGWRKSILTLSVLPITIMKNGLRIVTLSLLGNNLDERIISSPLHRQGGIPFFFLAVSFLFAVLWLLRRSEEKVEVSSGVK